MSGMEVGATIKVKGLEGVQKAFAEMQARFEASAEKMRKAGERIGDGVDKSLKATTTTLRTTGTVGTRSFGLIRGAASGLLGILKSCVSFLAQIGKLALDAAGKVSAAGAGAFLAVQAFGIQTGKTLDELGRMADAAGVPVERFSRLATATRLLGGDVQDLGSGLSSLSDRVIDAAKDADGTGAKAFAQLGLSVRDAQGGLKSTEQMLGEVSDALAAIPSRTLRASAAQELFGGAASKLLPILERGSAGLEEYAREADKLGTVVTEQQTKTARGLLVQFRKVTEALRGIAYKIADHLLPFLTTNSNAIAMYLAENGDSIAAFAGRVLREIAGISADLGRAITGDAAKVEREWVRKLIPAVTTVKNVVLDLLDLFTGGSATRAPWLRQVGESLRDAGAAALSLANGIRKAAGFGDSQLPSLQQAADAVAEAFASMRAGIEGRGEIKMPWAANVGETLRNVGAAIGIVAGVIVTHREAITSFAADFTMLLSQGLSAIASLLSGDAIAADNPFAFLQGWKDSARAFYEGMKEDALWLKDQVVAAYEGIKPIVTTLWQWFDGLAKVLGFNNGGELGILIVVAQMTGLLDIAQTLATALAAVALMANNFLGAVIKVGQIGFAIFKTVLVPVVTALATALGLPVAAVGAIVAAVAALGLAVWYWWDEIKAACAWLWDLVVAGFDAMLDAAVAVWDGVKSAAVDAWDAVVAAWEGVTSFFAGLFDAVREGVESFWDWMTAAPGRAWDGLVSVWSGFSDFFSGIVDRVKGYFKGLWDGVKNGAADAWNSVKGWFGFGEDEGAGSADLSPRLRSGGIVRGPGTGVSDSIRAWLSNGEGVVNAAAVRHYGEGFIHSLNNMLLPRTHFATGGIVGEMVPAAAAARPAMSGLHLNVFGQRASDGLYADEAGMRALKRLRSGASSARGPAPRWKGY